MNKGYDTTKPYKGKILSAIESTWESPYSHVTRWPNQPYPLIRARHNSLVEVDHTDGIGTKGLIHFMSKNFRYAAQDALAMNLNDLLAVRATPYKLQNHLTLAYDDHDAILKTVEALATFCKQYKIAMTGGETSIMDTVQGMDLSVTVTGFVNDLRGSLFQTGDLLVGLASSGVHSNGFSTVRKYYGGAGLLKFIEPTIIYWDKVFPHLENINACVHMAGGGFTRLKDFLQFNQSVKIERYKTRHPVFEEMFNISKQYKPLKNMELTEEDMYSTFNCGIGMILSVSPEKVESVLTPLGGEIIGEIVAGDGNQVMIESIFSDNTLMYKGGVWTKTT